MIKRFTMPFLLSTLLLVVLESIFLQEVFSAKRVLVIAASVAGIRLAFLYSILFFAKYNKASKEF